MLTGHTLARRQCHHQLLQYLMVAADAAYNFTFFFILSFQTCLSSCRRPFNIPCSIGCELMLTLCNQQAICECVWVCIQYLPSGNQSVKFQFDIKLKRHNTQLNIVHSSERILWSDLRCVWSDEYSIFWTINFPFYPNDKMIGLISHVHTANTAVCMPQIRFDPAHLKGCHDS